MIAACTVGFTPCIFEDGGVEVAAVVAGNHAPEVEAVGIVDAVETSHVDTAGGAMFGEVKGVDVLGDEAERFGLFDGRGGVHGR